MCSVHGEVLNKKTHHQRLHRSLPSSRLVNKCYRQSPGMPELTLSAVTGVEFSLWESYKLVGLAASRPWLTLWLPGLGHRVAQPACFLRVQVRCVTYPLWGLFVMAGRGKIISPWLSKLFHINNWALCFGSELQMKPCHTLLLILKSLFSEMHLSLITVSKVGGKGWVVMKLCHNKCVNKELGQSWTSLIL